MRLHAARHSVLLMCVAGSQKSMQARSVLPPPPGALGTDSLGEPGDSARLLFVVPPVANWVGSWGERGAMREPEARESVATREGLGVITLVAGQPRSECC